MSRVDNTVFYNASIAEHGLSVRGLHWLSRHAQEIRFDQLLDLLPLDARKIVDVGCGFGDLYVYAQKHQREHIEYIGIDVLDTMVIEAHRRTGKSILKRDVLHDPLPESEYYLCSGAMNILTRYEAHQFIQRCYEASEKGFIFNFLEGEDRSHIYNYLLLSEIENLGERLGAKIIVRQGYFDNDCTVAFYKEVT